MEIFRTTVEKTEWVQHEQPPSNNVHQTTHRPSIWYVLSVPNIMRRKVQDVI